MTFKKQAAEFESQVAKTDDPWIALNQAENSLIDATDLIKDRKVRVELDKIIGEIQDIKETFKW